MDAHQEMKSEQFELVLCNFHCSDQNEIHAYVLATNEVLYSLGIVHLR